MAKYALEFPTKRKYSWRTASGRIDSDVSLSSKERRPWDAWDVSGFPYAVLLNHLEIGPNPFVYHEILKEMAQLKKPGKQGSPQKLGERCKR